MSKLGICCSCRQVIYHIHAVVPAGGMSADHQRWIHTTHPLFLLPVPLLGTVFRKEFLAGLGRLYRKGRLNLRGPAAPFRQPACFELLMRKLGNKKWYVQRTNPDLSFSDRKVAMLDCCRKTHCKVR